MTIGSLMALAVPSRLAVRMRAEKNQQNLSGLHAPAKVLTDLVPAGRVAVDAGASAGLNTYWFAQAASHVHAFEPQPQVFERLKGPSSAT